MEITKVVKPFIITGFVPVALIWSQIAEMLTLQKKNYNVLGFVTQTLLLVFSRAALFSSLMNS